MKRPSPIARDCHDQRVYAGDTVRRYRSGSDVIHWRRRATLSLQRIEAVGDRNDEHLRGLICVDGTWSSPRNFEKVVP